MRRTTVRVERKRETDAAGDRRAVERAVATRTHKRNAVVSLAFNTAVFARRRHRQRPLFCKYHNNTASEIVSVSFLTFCATVYGV